MFHMEKKRRDRFFRVVDEYTLFYMKWIKPLVEGGIYSSRGSYWQKMSNSPARYTWSGFAFENVCYKHIDQIGQALGLDNIAYVTGGWRFIPPKKSKDNGAQIDLLFDRDDEVITICEIKYSDKLFVIDKAYAKSLNQKIDVFERNFPSRSNPTRKQIHLALISTFGVKKNMYSEDLVHNGVTLDDLFS